MTQDSRHQLPAVHQLLADAEREGIVGTTARPVVVNTIRDLLAEARSRGGDAPAGGWLPALGKRLEHARAPSLARVINATGVVLHTNLGRAPLARAAVEAMTRASTYNTLEYDLESGERGSRRVHVRSLLCELTGAEDALVVTNAAAALIVALNTFADGGETIVSRGELIEIGGAFRIPEILEKSGTTLVEVGTTNRTHLRDYEAAISPRTKCLLKVHRSNFTMTGFTAEVALDELTALAAPRGVAVLNDVGSGLLVDLSHAGLSGEPIVPQCAATGATVLFSGDKLLGGPQAGIIVGPRERIAPAAQNPFARAMRPDKLVLAALEATLDLYRDPQRALIDIPTLAMLTADAQSLRAKAEALAHDVRDATLEAGTSAVGGGSFPGCDLATTLVAIPTAHPDDMLAQLRFSDPSIIARAADRRVLFDPRTIAAEEIPLVRQNIRQMMGGARGEGGGGGGT
jgi:L-seryl-tRNA(Ser) seleniumtransferase